VRRWGVVICVCLTVVLGTVVAVKVSRSIGPRSAVAGASSGGGTALHSSAARLPVTGASPSASSGAGSGTQVPAQPVEAIGGLLDGRANAIRDGDRAAWLAALDPSADPVAKRFRTAQAAVFDRVRTLRPASWSYQVAGGTVLPAKRRTALGSSAWLADVHLEYQLTAGGATVKREQFLTIVRRADGWRIATDTDGSTGRDVWDLGPISHSTAARCLVVGARARRAQIAQLAAECGRAARTVDAAWGTTWTRRTVLTVPATLNQLAILLGRGAAGSDNSSGSKTAKAGPDTAGLDRTAAVTIGRADAPADEVLINGTAFDDLRALGRRVVLTHELVHVATRATGSRSAPTWLEEGYADYVAYADTGLSAGQVAGAALAQVRKDGVPHGLPSANDFNAAGDNAEAAYGEAWLAAQLIASKAGGAHRMKAFYQRAAVGSAAETSKARAGAVNAALAQVGLAGTAAFVRLWQARLRKLAG
jgi:hypothetical protein